MKSGYKSIAGLVAVFLLGLGIPQQPPRQKTWAMSFFDMDIAQLMQITITSVSKRPQSLTDSAAAVSVITADDIHQMDVTSIPEALLFGVPMPSMGF